MDLPLLLTALVLGIVEGLTEFLPISSTGHLIVLGDLLGYNDDASKVFKIVIQLGAILAVCWDYRERLLHIAGTLTTERASQRFVGLLFVGFLPAAVLGLMFHATIKSLLFNPITVATALVIGGVVILYVEKRAYHPRIHAVDAMRWSDALKVGFAQALAMIPGTSRSGATIMGGLIFGLSRKSAAEFSFFLAIPTMFAATVYDLYKNWALLRLEDLPVFAVGFVASFVAAMWAVRGFIKFISNHTFVGFAWYRIVFGLVVLATWYFGWVEWSEP
ncbi:MAG: undecaprenyl-diphosphate phosphatase [Thauera phenolivorans]|uniref:Undecaprenyl-diphosphatase n=1 Tax=Thauera phenolivorans TaxID=1792543 RepID=A0A7X7LW81_9RHOO|nr:undecaprenyl-diphosphate phosphatase [Thauera phenolivorans]NLF54428.1 undecaprenyl-diphosphate phosphatase [Thauera phenolivorans]